MYICILDLVIVSFQFTSSFLYRTFVKDIEQKNSFLIRSIISYFVCLATIIVTMFICFPIGLLSDLLASPRAHKS